MEGGRVRERGGMEGGRTREREKGGECNMEREARRMDSREDWERKERGRGRRGEGDRKKSERFKLPFWCHPHCYLLRYSKTLEDASLLANWPTDDDAERWNVLPKTVFCDQRSILECLTVSQRKDYPGTRERERGRERELERDEGDVGEERGRGFATDTR